VRLTALRTQKIDLALQVFQIAMKLAKEKAEEGEDVNQMKKLWLE